ATLETQGNRVTLNKMLFTIDVLRKYIEKSLTLYYINKDLFNEYYRKTNNSPLYATALILYPNRCTKYAKIW
ncbi:hypothetical protein K458DRAFT_307722, partial [Lentithecium fluviatile CBS 122367]